MVKLNNYSLNLGYPIYGANFVNDHTVIVAGGGGDGNNGIPNKMTAILIQPENKKKPIKRYRELTLNDNEDSVMSLGVGNGTILAGINENSAMMAKGVNKHLRRFKFENEHLKFVESCQIHPNTNSTIYQKITAITDDGLTGVIVMSDTPSSVYIVDLLGDMEEKFKIVTDGDVKDVTISKDGKLMCYITTTVFEVISLVTGRSVFKTKQNFLMSKIRFLDNNEVIISGSKSKDAFVAKFSIANSKIVEEKVVYRNMKGITSMDVNVKNNLTVLATSNYSLLLVRTSDLKVIKILNKVHEFAITKVVFSEDGRYLVSCSAANTVNVVEIPDNFAATKSMLSTLFHYVISIVLIALLSIGMQYLYGNGYIDIALDKATQMYEAYRPQDSSKYFTVESIPSFETTTINSVASKNEPSPSLSPTEIQTTVSSEFSSTPLQVTSNDVTSSFMNSSLTEEVTDSSVTELSSEFDKKKLTIDGDIVSSNEITTTTGYTVSTEAFLDEETRDEPSSSSLASSESVLTPKSEPTVTDTSSSNPSLETIPTDVPSLTTSTPVVEVTKEVVKEITSIITSTQTEISVSTSTATETAFSTLTSVEMFTEIHTSIETSISVSTSVVVQFVTKEIPVTSSSFLIPETTVSGEQQLQIETESPLKSSSSTLLSSSEDLAAGTQYGDVISETETAGYETFLSTTLEAASHNTSSEIAYTAQATTSKLQEKETKNTISSFEDVSSEAVKDSVSIQIEPLKKVYNDSALAIEEAEKNAIEEINSKDAILSASELNIVEEAVKETVGETAEENIEDAVETESTPEVSIQIEPVKEVYDNYSEAQEAEAEKVLSELTAEGAEPSSSKLDISSVTPIVLLETESPTTSIIKDEL